MSVEIQANIHTSVRSDEKVDRALRVVGTRVIRPIIFLANFNQPAYTRLSQIY